jgi:hypothetical protein
MVVKYTTAFIGGIDNQFEYEEPFQTTVSKAIKQHDNIYHANIIKINKFNEACKCFIATIEE